MRHKLPEEDKRKRVNVLLSQNERMLLKEKMTKYGYTDLSSYLRDAGIYEKIFVEDIAGKEEISKLINTMIDETQKYLSDQKKIMMKSSLTKDEIQLLSEQNRQILEAVKDLIKQIDDVLWVSSRMIAEDPSRFVKQAKLFEDNDIE